MNWYQLSKDEKLQVIQQASVETGLPDSVIEKDWWVQQTLAIIFEMELGQHLVFKGGTSLSKAWGLIERFSEDIDLAIDRCFFGAEFEGDLGTKKRDKLREETSSYIQESLYPALVKAFSDKGFNEVTIELVPSADSEADPREINIFYTPLTKADGYVEQRVKVEIGCRSLREPFVNREIASFIDQTFPDSAFFESPISVPTVIPERTFLEKIFLLHEEFQRPPEKRRVERLSRHLYDIHQISSTPYAANALGDLDLYETIVNHRYKFTKVGRVNYNLHQPQTINPIPPTDIIEAWRTDYNTMRESMIPEHANRPEFDDLIQSIQALVVNINAFKWKMTSEFPIPAES